MTDVGIVTGATGALGAEVARVLAKRGHPVALLDHERHADRLERLAGTLGGATWFAGDVATDATWLAALDRVERKLGARPTRAAIVAGAWGGGRPLHEETDDETWRAMMLANVETAYRSLRALLPAMVAGRNGSIVVVGSRVVEQPWTGKGAVAYTAAKSTVVAMARATAAEVLQYGVRVNAILPSTMDTPANRAAMPNADPSSWVPLRAAADLIAFLLSDESRHISGVSVPIYGRA